MHRFLWLFAIIFAVSIVAETRADSFTISTSYWFHDIEAVCANNTCDVHVNGEYKKTVNYTMSGDVANTSIHNINISYNTITKELTY